MLRPHSISPIHFSSAPHPPPSGVRGKGPRPRRRRAALLAEALRPLFSPPGQRRARGRGSRPRRRRASLLAETATATLSSPPGRRRAVLPAAARGAHNGCSSPVDHQLKHLIACSSTALLRPPPLCRRGAHGGAQVRRDPDPDLRALAPVRVAGAGARPHVDAVTLQFYKGWCLLIMCCGTLVILLQKIHAMQFCQTLVLPLTERPNKAFWNVYLCRYKMATTPGSVMALGSVIALLLGQLNLQGSTQYNDAISCIFTSENFCIYIQDDYEVVRKVFGGITKIKPVKKRRHLEMNFAL